MYNESKREMKMKMEYYEDENLFPQMIQLESIPEKGSIINGMEVYDITVLEINNEYSGAIYGLDGFVLYYYDLMEGRSPGIFIDDTINVVRTDTIYYDVIIIFTTDGDTLVGYLE